MLPKSLFVEADGTSMLFTIRPCAERKRLRPLIEQNGGRFSIKGTESNCIKLIEDGKIVHCLGYYFSNYIDDCIKNGKLLDKDKYMIKERGVVANFRTQLTEDIFDFNTPKATVTVSKKYGGRKKYLQSDDMNIIMYLVKNKLCREVGGNNIWKEIEYKKICVHSWQSIRKHFFDIIQKNIASYPIDATWKSMIASGGNKTGSEATYDDDDDDDDEDEDDDDTDQGKSVDVHDNADGDSANKDYADDVVEIDDSESLDEFDKQLLSLPPKTLKIRNRRTSLRNKSLRKSKSIMESSDEDEENYRVAAKKTRTISSISPLEATKIKSSPVLVFENTRQNSGCSDTSSPSPIRKIRRRTSTKVITDSPCYLDRPSVAESDRQIRNKVQSPHVAEHNQNRVSRNGHNVSKHGDGITAGLDIPLVDDQMAESAESDVDAVSVSSVEAAIIPETEKAKNRVIDVIKGFQTNHKEVTTKQALKLLWQFSNVIDDVYHYLKHGRGTGGQPPWNSADDKVLRSWKDDKEIEVLVTKYTEKHVRERISFLDSTDHLRATLLRQNDQLGQHFSCCDNDC